MTEKIITLDAAAAVDALHKAIINAAYQRPGKTDLEQRVVDDMGAADIVRAAETMIMTVEAYDCHKIDIYYVTLAKSNLSAALKDAAQ